MAVQYVDLHMHTPASDGFWTPETLPPAARALGLDVVAIADHDEVAGVAPMMAACGAADIQVIPAVEVSVLFDKVGYHVLLYHIDLWNATIRDTFGAVRAHYDAMCRSAIAELERRGKRLDPDKSPALRGEALKVYHLVAALVDQGHAENMTKAYEQCVEVGARYDWTPSLEEALALGHGAGGLAVIAHPGRAEPGFTAAGVETLDRMRAAGLDGIECFHSFHNAAAVAFYLTYAQRHDLLISAGSDSHGPGQSPRPLTAWPAVQVAALLERCGIASAAPVPAGAAP